MMHRSFLVIVVSVLLAACQTPTAYGPQVSQQELAAERAEQQRSVQRKTVISQAPITPEQRAQMQARLQRVSKTISFAGARVCEQIRPAGTPCSFTFVLDKEKRRKGQASSPSSEVNAYADGERIVVTPGMMNFATTDEELALVLSHEYAHNVMSHVASQQVNTMAGTIVGLALDVAAASQGLDTGGGFQNIGGNVGLLSYSAAFEREADYVGLYIMQHSGYNTQRAVDFWRRMAGLNPSSITEAGTHPTTPERFVAMKKTMAEIQYKKDNKLVLLPDFKPER